MDFYQCKLATTSFTINCGFGPLADTENGGFGARSTTSEPISSDEHAAIDRSTAKLVTKPAIQQIALWQQSM